MAVLYKKRDKAQYVSSTALAMAQSASSVLHLASASTDSLALCLVSAFVLTHIVKSWERMRSHSNAEDGRERLAGNEGNLHVGCHSSTPV